jgi:hypothetical protein
MAKFNIGNIIKRAGGAAAGGALGYFGGKFLSKMSPKVRGLLMIAAGAAIPEFMPKNPMVEAAGAGLAGVGAATFLTPAAVQGIYGDDPAVAAIDLNEEYLHGDIDVSGVDDDVSGNDQPAVLGDDDMQGVGSDDGMDGIGYDDDVNGLGYSDED